MIEEVPRQLRQFGAINIVLTDEKLGPYSVLYASCGIAHQIETINKLSFFSNILIFLVV